MGSNRGRGGRPVTNAEQAKIEARRHQVAAMLLEGRTYREIGEASGVAASTIAEDVKHVREEWKARNAEEFSDLVAFECAKLDRLEARLWPEINRGRPWAFEAFVKISRRRGRLLGLDTAEKLSGVVYHHEERAPLAGGKTLGELFGVDEEGARELAKVIHLRAKEAGIGQRLPKEA